jgi:hypothetical protein
MRIDQMKLTLDCPATYEVIVPGELDQNWLDCDEKTIVTKKYDLYSYPVTVLVVTLDQAALQGLLRKLYSLGLPLISVVWVEA